MAQSNLMLLNKQNDQMKIISWKQAMKDNNFRLAWEHRPGLARQNETKKKEKSIVMLLICYTALFLFVMVNVVSWKKEEIG